VSSGPRNVPGGLLDKIATDGHECTALGERPRDTLGDTTLVPTKSPKRDYT
jgi:hypothetical protein